MSYLQKIQWLNETMAEVEREITDLPPSKLRTELISYSHFLSNQFGNMVKELEEQAGKLVRADIKGPRVTFNSGPSNWQVSIKEFNGTKIDLIKIIRAATGFLLRESKKMADPLFDINVGFRPGTLTDLYEGFARKIASEINAHWGSAHYSKMRD